MRTDAVRNQGRILEAAREQITASGPDVSMVQIADAAGVAVGTLYRHYPTKRDLVQAILTEYSEALLAQAEDAARSTHSPGDAMAQIVTLLTTFIRTASNNQAIKAAAASLNAANSTAAQDDRAHVALQVLLDAAKIEGDIRPDITPDDILLLMISAPTDIPQSSRERWLQICLTGIAGPRPV